MFQIAIIIKTHDIELILKSYIKANYPVELDSSNYIKINDENKIYLDILSLTL